MVLITDDREGGGSSPVKLKQIQKSRSRSEVHPAHTVEYAHFSEKYDYPGSCEEEDDGDEELSELPDTRSIASDDSFYPPDDNFEDSERTLSPESPVPLSLYQACCSNNAAIVLIMIRQGVSEDEVRETDKNSRTGLIVACYQGYVDVVVALAECPYIDVNWQDNEGNTALITAAQAGHITISNYLLNYYSGLDIERRNCHGFTALMKAAMQGRTDCVRALMLAGADLEARDDGRRLTPRQWALFTGRHETAHLMLRLMTQPCPEQYRDSYRAEWPRLPELVASAREPRGWLHKLSETVRGALSFAAGSEPADGGVLDHMVRATTGLTSPFVATACRTVCPGSPPCVSKRRYSVQEILRRERGEPLQSPDPERHGDHGLVSRHFRATLAPRRKDRRPSAEDAARQRHGSLLATRPARRGSVRPDAVLPKLRVTKAPPPDYEPEKSRKKSSCKDEHFLQIPKWRYKELKEERKKAEEAEKKKMEEAERKRVVARRLLLTGKRK
ncbi:ankyrin repeat domain-containing protein 33B isoform X1 [Anguilla anguilla]|uniref:ankyrin repeat domain-containing protein 33B isoform X1 n=2 Tax=Anguilla anguilla TaxID=7936 RepID=UPI0015AA9845|nr:ankyrin repeat domain-containing protein 33B isoform X1 [Anguilla anguilla]